MLFLFAFASTGLYTRSDSYFLFLFGGFVRVLHAGEKINRQHNENIIALLGPVPRSEETSHYYWNQQALDLLNASGFKGVALIPVRRGCTFYNMNDVQNEDYMTREMQWNGQMFQSLIEAGRKGVFAFWIPRNEHMKAKYTEQEFYDLVPKYPHNVVMGIPKHAQNVEALIQYCTQSQIEVNDNLKCFAQAVVQKLA